MKFGVLGGGMVGETIASKLVERGHEVRMGSRSKADGKSAKWAKAKGAKASVGSFAEAAQFGDLVFNCLPGHAAVAVLKGAADGLGTKVLVDVSNPIVASDKGFSLFVSNTDSLAEQIQRAVPRARVVKALNTLTFSLMTNPSLLPGDHNLFVSGNDAAAKKEVLRILSQEFGWKPGNILDLGDLTGARAQEAYLHFWIRVMQAKGSPMFNAQILAPKN